MLYVFQLFYYTISFIALSFTIIMISLIPFNLEMQDGMVLRSEVYFKKKTMTETHSKFSTIIATYFTFSCVLISSYQL